MLRLGSAQRLCASAARAAATKSIACRGRVRWKREVARHADFKTAPRHCHGNVACTETKAHGSCGCGAASVRLGLCAGDVTVAMPGGGLEIGVTSDFALTMLGRVGKVAEGIVSAELLGDAG